MPGLTCRQCERTLSSTEALISHCKLEIEKLRRQLSWHPFERTARLLEQMELQLEELEATATEDELAAEQARGEIARTIQSFQRKRPSRKPFPDHLPRRACGDPGAGQLSLLRLGPAVEAWRRHHRDAGSCSATVEGDPDRAREVLLPGLRKRLPSLRRRSM